MKKRNYKYFFHYMGVAFFLILLLVFLINILTPDKSFSQKENRVLSSKPELNLSQITSGKFSPKYETYVNDQFPLRDTWVTLKAGCDRLMGKTEENGVYLGKDGYLMEAFNPPPQKQLDSTLTAMTDFAQSHSNIKQYALIAPNAVNILEEKLPFAAPAIDQNPYIDTVKDTLNEAGLTFIDVRDALSEHKDEGIYYQTDHHWTTQGAWFAFNETAKIMEIDASSLEYESVPVSESFQGTLSAKSGFRSGKKEELSVFLPTGDAPSSVVNYVNEQKKSGSFYVTEQLKVRDKYALFFNGSHPQVKISTPVKENRTLLILKDSYANCFVPFLAPHYRNIIMVDPRYYYGDLEKLIQVENVQEILYLFFSDTSLELTLSTQ